jgi:hypothetical protein
MSNKTQKQQPNKVKEVAPLEQPAAPVEQPIAPVQSVRVDPMIAQIETMLKDARLPYHKRNNLQVKLDLLKQAQENKID